MYGLSLCAVAQHFLLTKLESGLFKSRTFKSVTSFKYLNHVYVNYWLDFILFFNVAFMKRASLGKKKSVHISVSIFSKCEDFKCEVFFRILKSG